MELVPVPAPTRPRCGATPACRSRRGTWQDSRRQDRPAPRCARKRPRRRPAASGNCPASAGRITCISIRLIVAGAAFVGVAVALDQPRAFRDLEREARRIARMRRRSRPSQRLDLALFFPRSPIRCPRPPAPKFCEHPETQIAAHRRGVELHAPVEARELHSRCSAKRKDTARRRRRQHRAQFLDAGLEEFEPLSTGSPGLAATSAAIRAKRAGSVFACATRITSS